MAESVEKLEDGIVRSAEQVSAQVRAAKDAIASVIFGQDRVIENTLVTILSGGHALLIGVPGLAKTKLVETPSVSTLSHKNISEPTRPPQITRKTSSA